MKGLAVALSLLAVKAAAKCAAYDDCGCGDAPAGAAILAWQADGGVVVEASAGTIDTTGRVGASGTRTLALPSGKDKEVDAAGNLRCGVARVPAATWPAALLDRSCTGKLSAAGFVYNCHDNGCDASAAAFPALLAAMLWLRRRTH